MPTETGSSPEVLKPKKSFLKKEKDKILRVLTADYMSSEESDANDNGERIFKRKAIP